MTFMWSYSIFCKFECYTLRNTSNPGNIIEQKILIVYGTCTIVFISIVIANDQLETTKKR